MYKVYYNNSAFASDVTFLNEFDVLADAEMALSEFMLKSKHIIGIIMKDNLPIRTYFANND